MRAVLAFSAYTAIVALSCASALAAPGGAGVPLQVAEIHDSQGFSQPVPAMVLQMPTGWRGQGGVTWDWSTNCSSNQVRVEWKSASRDGSAAFEIMHGFGWQLVGRHIPTNPCPVLPFNSALAFLRAVVQQRRPGARELEYRDRPDLAQMAEQETPVNPQIHRRFDVGQLFIAYRIGDQEFHEVLSSAVAFTEYKGTVMGGTARVTALRAPIGRLDLSLNDSLYAAIKPNPHWLKLAREAVGGAGRQFAARQLSDIQNWHAAEMAKINAKGASDRAAIRAQANREVSAINAQTQANTQATNERIQRRDLEALGEYNTYRDSGGNQVRSSIHGGDRVLRLPDGNYTSTRDPYYNPAGSEELRKVR